MPHSPRTPGPVHAAADLLRSLGGFLRTPMGLDEATQRIEQQYLTRDHSLLRLFREAVFAHPTSPYARLLAHAGITYEDVQTLVRTHGVEETLSQLHVAGVHLTLDEFKGRRPIRRGSIEISTHPTDFDNRALSPHFEVRTGGSRGPGRALLVDLDLLTHEASYELFAAVEFGLAGRSTALWRPVPPGSAGIKILLRRAKVGLPITHWFSQSSPWSPADWQHTLFTTGMMVVSRVAGRPQPWPEHVPADRALSVARWLSVARTDLGAGVLNTNAASAVRVCQAAEDHGLDISGAFFQIGGEPYTSSKAAVFARAGCRAATHYSLAEAGRIGNACSRPSALDDVHVALDKVAMLARDVLPPGAASPVSGLFLTTLHASTPKVMINVELGDYGTLSRRSCGCPWEHLGHTLHLQDIRSYEKLTTEGMHFIGSDLLSLVEETLPGQFGGHSMDYQLVEEEHNGMPSVTLVVSQRVGTLDEGRLKAVVLARLGSANAASRMMARRWQDAGTLRVARREPYATAAGKVLALHAPLADRRDA